MDINKLYINRDYDHHVISGANISTGDGGDALAVTFQKQIGPGKYLYRAEVIYRKPEQTDPAGAMIFCNKTVEPDGTETYTERATWTIPAGSTETYPSVGSILTQSAAYGDDMTVYEVLPKEKSFIDLTLNHIDEHVFIEAATLSKEEKEELAALTDMCAHEILEEYLDNNAEGEVVNGDGDPSDMNISGDPGSVSHAKVAFLNPATPDRITWFDWSLSMLKPDGTSSPAPLYLISDKEKESCTLTAPTGLPSGQINVKVVYTYKTPDSNIKRRCKGTFIVGGWNDPVIMVDDEDTYDKCDEYGMIMSPASKDAANFAGCRDLTMGEMINEPAMTVCRAKGWLNAGKAKKAEFLMGQGMGEAEANALADKFMLLSEAKVVNLGGSIGTNPSSATGAFKDYTSLTHFESFGYFINFGSNANNGIACFDGCTNLTTLFMPTSVVIIPQYACYGCALLENVKTLKD